MLVLQFSLTGLLGYTELKSLNTKATINWHNGYTESMVAHPNDDTIFKEVTVKNTEEFLLCAPQIAECFSNTITWQPY